MENGTAVQRKEPAVGGERREGAMREDGGQSNHLWSLHRHLSVSPWPPMMEDERAAAAA